MTVEIEQGLYGYKNGHRALASSIPIEGEAARTLRSVTDMAFDGASDTYLTCVPLPDIRRQGVIRTWPAPEASRPGSVWSHVLLIDFVDLGRLDGLASLDKLFRRPKVGSNGEPDLESYRTPTSFLSKPSAAGAKGRHADRLRLLWAIYGDNLEQRVIRAQDPGQLEPLLFAVWQQQWPRLRRSFSFRTRYRVGVRSNGFSIQIVERLQRDQTEPEVPAPHPGWLTRLEEDLSRPRSNVQDLLRHFGAESEDGQRDLPALLGLLDLIDEAASPALIANHVCAAFPRVKQMPRLKAALFGPTSEGPLVWTTSETARLSAILQAVPAAALSLRDLEIGPRLDTLWESDSQAAVDLMIGTAGAHAGNKKALRLLIESAVLHAKPGDVVAIAEREPTLATALVSQRPDLLSAPALWRSGEEVAQELVRMVAGRDREAWLEVFRTLLQHGVIDGACELIRQEPAAWWEALDWAAGAVSANRSVARTSSFLGKLLDAAGPAAIGSPPHRAFDPSRLALLAAAADPSAGLWRQAEASEWAAAGEEIISLLEGHHQTRAAVVLVAATKATDSKQARRRLWLASFPPLHAALLADNVDAADLVTLRAVLATPGDEISHLLRAAVTREMRRGEWPPRDVQAIVAAAGPYGAEIVETLTEKPKKKKRAWWRDVIDYVIP